MSYMDEDNVHIAKVRAAERREVIATAALAGLLAGRHNLIGGISTAEAAVIFADALIQELDK